MKHLPIILAIATSAAFAGPEIDAFVDAGGDYSSPEAYDLQRAALEKQSLTASERAFALNVQQARENASGWHSLSASFVHEHAEKDPLIGAFSAAKGTDPSAWSDEEITVGIGPALFFLRRHPDETMLARVVVLLQGTGQASENWRKAFNLYRASLSTSDALALVEAEIDALMALDDPTDAQARWTILLGIHASHLTRRQLSE